MAGFESLRQVAGRHDDVAIPTHGSPIASPSTFVSQLIAHREQRERQILEAIRRGLSTVPDIVTELYADVRVELHKPAARSVLSHLVKLVDDGLVAMVDATGQRPRLDTTYVGI